VQAVEAPIERDLADCTPSPSECAVRSERCDLLSSAIARLEPSERRLLLLRFDLDLSYREIAEIEGAPETTVKSRVYKLLGRLRDSLESSVGKE
jgi:RNA polymerase sigma-70 factor (ECF subfamily)